MEIYASEGDIEVDGQRRRAANARGVSWYFRWRIEGWSFPRLIGAESNCSRSAVISLVLRCRCACVQAAPVWIRNLLDITALTAAAGGTVRAIWPRIAISKSALRSRNKIKVGPRPLSRSWSLLEIRGASRSICYLSREYVRTVSLRAGVRTRSFAYSRYNYLSFSF